MQLSCLDLVRDTCRTYKYGIYLGADLIVVGLADLIFILLDRPDESHDRRISEHIMQAHGSSGWSGEPPSKRQRDASGASLPAPLSEPDDSELTLAQRLRRSIQSAIHNTGSLGLGHDSVLAVELMRRYIEYAKLYVHPTLSTAAAKVLQRLYLTMRAQASAGQSIPVTTRHLESLIRLAQARARIDLRDEVNDDTCTQQMSFTCQCYSAWEHLTMVFLHCVKLGYRLRRRMHRT